MPAINPAVSARSRVSAIFAAAMLEISLGGFFALGRMARAVGFPRGDFIQNFILMKFDSDQKQQNAYDQSGGQRQKPRVSDFRRGGRA